MPFGVTESVYFYFYGLYVDFFSFFFLYGPRIQLPSLDEIEEFKKIAAVDMYLSLQNYWFVVNGHILLLQ
jgi:hypothetical protein